MIIILLLVNMDITLDINIKSIMFIVNDDVFMKEDYETILLKRYVEIEKVKKGNEECSRYSNEVRGSK